MARLALEHAPAPAAPLRFLAVAPAWGLLAGLLLLWQGEALLQTRWSPATVGFVHLLTLGVLGNAMLGSLWQFLPVVAGVRMPGPRMATAIHAGLNLGLLGFATALLAGPRALLLPASGLMVASLLVFALGVLRALWRAGLSARLRRALLAPMSALVGGAVAAEVNPELRSTDQKVNQLEREIRRELVVHASVLGRIETPAVLIYMSIVKDIERIGDYAKNLLDLALDGADFRNTPDAEEWRELEQRVSRYMADVGAAFGRRDAEGGVDRPRIRQRHARHKAERSGGRVDRADPCPVLFQHGEHERSGLVRRQSIAARAGRPGAAALGRPAGQPDGKTACHGSTRDPRRPEDPCAISPAGPASAAGRDPAPPGRHSRGRRGCAPAVRLLCSAARHGRALRRSRRRRLPGG